MEKTPLAFAYIWYVSILVTYVFWAFSSWMQPWPCSPWSTHVYRILKLLGQCALLPYIEFTSRNNCCEGGNIFMILHVEVVNKLCVLFISKHKNQTAW